MMRQRAVFATIAFLSGTYALVHVPGSQAADSSAKRVELSSGGVIGGPGGRPQLLFTIRNKSERTLWVEVRFAAPGANPECVSTRKVEPGEKAPYPCPQEKVAPDTDYPIIVSVRLDEAAEPVESTQTKMRFSAGDVAAFEKFLTPPTIPVTFKAISSTRKPGIGTALFGPLASMRANDSDTLVVAQDSVQYTSKGNTVSIPVSRIRSVNVKQFDRTGVRAWVVVEYEEADGMKVIAFQGNPNIHTTETLDEIARAIQYVIRNGPDTAQER